VQKTPAHLRCSQQSVVGFHEESSVGLPSSFLIWRRACLSCGLHFSESEGMTKCCVVRIRRRSSKCCMVDDIILFSIHLLAIGIYCTVLHI
jgi:hypothetical protein